MIGLITRANSEPLHGSDHTLSVAFGGRPAGLENALGHFANAMPIKIPFTEAIRSHKVPQTLPFDSLVKLVSKGVSTAKKHERMSILDVAKAANKKGMIVSKAQVAVTLSPKLSRPECCLYPVEGPYDLFFCFLEADSTVTLGVRRKAAPANLCL